jgi:hypothetical protein
MSALLTYRILAEILLKCAVSTDIYLQLLAAASNDEYITRMRGQNARCSVRII